MALLAIHVISKLLDGGLHIRFSGNFEYPLKIFILRAYFLAFILGIALHILRQ